MYISWHNYILKLGFTLMHQIGCLSNEISPRQRICCSFARANHLLATYRGAGWGRGGSGRFLAVIWEEINKKQILFDMSSLLSKYAFIFFYSSVGWEEEESGWGVGKERGREGGRGKDALSFQCCWSIFIVLKGLCICQYVNTKWHQLLADIINQQKFSSQ